ncbi:MAG: NAD-dependent epimerase/dehydratase family protein [Promethearchaeota archaeon]
MKNKVLLTGAFGNVGQNTLKQLLKQEYEVTCFDLQNSANKKALKKLSKKWQFKTIWGNILNTDDVSKAIEGIDTIIHLAAIIPPFSEKNPELARKVNVEGTQNLINAAKMLERKPRFIMASSVSVFGPTMHLEPPRRVDDPLNPSDHYSRSKVECEKMLRESGLPWMILRLGAVSAEKGSLELISILFDIPLEQRTEFISSIDCGIAFTNAATLDQTDKIFLIGGGENCQLIGKDFLTRFLDAFGLRLPSEKAFKKPLNKEDWFYIDWLDTKESQEALEFQTETFQQFVDRIKRSHRFRRLGIKIISPLANLVLLRKSPYYKRSNDNIA